MAISGAYVQPMISQPTDQFSSRRHRCPHKCNTIKQPHKEMVRNCRVFLLLSYFTHYCSIKLLFLMWRRDLWYWSPQTDFCPTTTFTRMHWLRHSRDAKRMVRNHCVLMIFSSSTHPFSNWIAIFGQMHDLWYRSPQTDFHHATATAPCFY